MGKVNGIKANLFIRLLQNENHRFQFMEWFNLMLGWTEDQLTPQLPIPIIELPARNAKATWGDMQLHRKAHYTSPNDLQMKADIGHVRACSFL
jgi:hypothetical protein